MLAAVPERKGGTKMTIKEVCEHYQIPADTLRYYEKIGIIPSVGRTTGGQRNYQESDLVWVRMAICLRGSGFPVDRLAEFVRLCREGNSTIEARLDLLLRQREEVRRQKEELEIALGRLDQKIAYYQHARACGCLCCDPSECSCDHPVQSCLTGSDPQEKAEDDKKSRPPEQAGLRKEGAEKHG